MVFLLHLLNYHRRYIDVDNILITIIDHVFTKYYNNQKKINHISNVDILWLVFVVKLTIKINK